MILWLATAATTLLLAVLALIDRARADWLPSATESWLNLLLTAAWACLAAWTVFDRRYNKWLFVIFAIHVPALLADVYILAAHNAAIGPSLLWKQALLFAAITLPAIAIASVVKSFTHFLLALAGIGLCLAILNGGGFQNVPSFFIQHHEIRDAAIRCSLAVAAIATIVFRSRGIAVAGAVAAISIAAWLPARVEYMAAATSAPKISLRTAPERSDPNHRQVYIPIKIDQLPTGLKFHSPKVEIAGLKAFVIPTEPGSHSFWLAILTDPATWKPRPLHGSAMFDFYREGSPSAQGCTSSQVEGFGADKLIKVLCEQPGPRREAVVTLRDPATAREWKQRLNSARNDAPGPHQVWLSPLSRAQTFFHLTPDNPDSPGSQWLVPASMAPAAQIEVTPEVPAGRALARFDIAAVP